MQGFKSAILAKLKNCQNGTEKSKKRGFSKKALARIEKLFLF
jgi:hypothetical protein